MFKKAFTLLELVMVIVVLGIVASIGADIIANLYENYIKTRAINSLQTQTELVLDQIQKRLTYRIKDSVIARDNTINNRYTALANANNTYNSLEWIGKDNEGFRGVKNPGWSGFVDLYSSDTNATQIKTNGSELNTTNAIISVLSNGNIDLNTTVQKPVIIFKGKSDYNVSKYGWDTAVADYAYKVRAIPNNILTFDKNATTTYEQYDLAWSAYALIPEGTNTNDFNLTLYYNYQPWEGEKYTDVNTLHSTLMEHVSTFRFSQIGETIRIKICINDANRSGDYNFGFCKERVIF